MSIGRFSRRGFAYQGWAWAGWSRASGEAVTVADPSQAGWIAKVANRLSVVSSQKRLSVCSPNQRVWIARQGNE